MDSALARIFLWRSSRSSSRRNNVFYELGCLWWIQLCSPKTQWRAYSRGRRWWSGSRRTPAWISAPLLGSCTHLKHFRHQFRVILFFFFSSNSTQWAVFTCSVFNIPYICHFFYTDRIFENQILHPKKRLKSPKTLKMSLKKSYICIFFTHSGKIYTWQKIFIQTCLWCLWQIKGMMWRIQVYVISR